MFIQPSDRIEPNRNAARTAFTLIELLTVIAIISLLIAILVPSLGKARDQAKNVGTKAILRAMGTGLDMFKGDNESEIVGREGYPKSARADDPTEEGDQYIFGAQWVVRYLLGKDLNGYVPKKNVPREQIEAAVDGWEQRDWYSDVATADNKYAPMDRSGPYIDTGTLELKLPKDLPGAMENGLPPDTDEKTYEQFVAVDNYGYPILYYAANSLLAARPNAPIATYDGTMPGVFNFSDNILFTGRCKGTACDYTPWDFGGGQVLNEANGAPEFHDIQDFGADEPPNRDNIDKNPKTFPYYILNKDAFEDTDRKTVMPFNKTGFLLISPGKDARYGTADDITNF